MHTIEKQERPNFSFVLPAISREPHCLFPARFLLPWIINESTSAYEFFFFERLFMQCVSKILWKAQWELREVEYKLLDLPWNFSRVEKWGLQNTSWDNYQGEKQKEISIGMGI